MNIFFPFLRLYRYTIGPFDSLGKYINKKVLQLGFLKMIISKLPHFIYNRYDGKKKKKKKKAENSTS